MKTQTAMEPEPARSAAAPSGGLLERVHRIYESIANRAYELFERRGGHHGHDLEDWLTAESELLVPVPVHIKQDDKQLTVRAEVPGFDKADIRVSVEGNRLLISGIRRKTDENRKANAFSASESSEEFLRVLDLPEAVDPSKAEARLDSGTLNIVLPKAEGEETSLTEIRVK
jgi:HSP20 family molecular chaperone IbpA